MVHDHDVCGDHSDCGDLLRIWFLTKIFADFQALKSRGWSDCCTPIYHTLRNREVTHISTNDEINDVRVN